MKKLFILKTLFLSAWLFMSEQAVAQCCTTPPDQNNYGSGNMWLGYVYQGTNFTSFKGTIQRGGTGANFDENFGGTSGTFTTDNQSISTQQFSVRFRLRKTFTAATYLFTVGANDGYRLSLDGGATWIINKWRDQPYTVTNYTVNIAGPKDMVLEYYANGSENRISFSMSTSALPVTITNWSTVLLDNNKTKLKWTADAALKLDRFVVQRSTNGIFFSDLHTIHYQQNGSHTKSYEYIDAALPSGTLYYRLAMVDQDGSVSYTSIQAVTSKKATGFTIFPTVVENNTLFIQTTTGSENSVVQVADLNGHIIHSQQLNSHSLSQQITFSNKLNPALYIVRLTDKKGNSQTLRFIAK